MARMVLAVSPAVVGRGASEFVCHFALVPKDDTNSARWSIDEEAIGETWHDSSWMLRRGLDVIEDVVLDPLPKEWARDWRLTAASAFESLRLVDLR